jgi:hypothetical protein
LILFAPACKARTDDVTAGSLRVSFGNLMMMILMQFVAVGAVGADWVIGAG